MFCGEQGKGGKYFEQENIFISEEKEKEENIWSMKITFWEKKSKEKKKENTRDWSVLNRSNNHIMNVNIVIIR